MYWFDFGHYFALYVAKTLGTLKSNEEIAGGIFVIVFEMEGVRCDAIFPVYQDLQKTFHRPGNTWKSLEVLL